MMPPDGANTSNQPLDYLRPGAAKQPPKRLRWLEWLIVGLVIAGLVYFMENVKL